MRSPKYYLRNTFFLLLYILLFLFLCGGLCFAEETYKITATELNQWEQELILQRNLLNRLEQNNRLQKRELTKQSTELKLSKGALMKQKILLDSTEQALNDANKSLTELGKELKAKNATIKLQRILCYGLTGVTLVTLLKKH